MDRAGSYDLNSLSYLCIGEWLAIQSKQHCYWVLEVLKYTESDGLWWFNKTRRVFCIHFETFLWLISKNYVQQNNT